MSKKTSSQLLLYTAPDGTQKLEVKLENETVWLSQEQLAELFQVDRSSITKHLKNVFETGELDQNRTCAKFAHVLNVHEGLAPTPR